MKDHTKAILIGAIIGSVSAVVAAVVVIRRIAVAASVLLFDPEDQHEENVDSLISKEHPAEEDEEVEK